MNNFRDAFRFHFTQIWYCALLFYVIFVNPTESEREIAIPLDLHGTGLELLDL